MKNPQRTTWAVFLSALGAAIVFTIIRSSLSSAAQGDYLSKELRARVEKLKAEAATPSTDAAVLQPRLQTLWEWSNAYSLTGGPAPVDYPLLVMSHFRTVRGAPSTDEAALKRAAAFIARYAHEFKIKDEQPNAIGKLQLSKTGPFRAGEYISIEQTYTVGEMPMMVGGGIVLTVGRGASPQVTDPAGEDFVTVRCSNPAARLIVAKEWGQGWTSFITRDVLAFRLEGSPLKKGETIAIHYGDTSRGSKGSRLQDFSNDRVNLPVHLDLEGKGELLTPHWPSFVVTGAAEVRYVNAIAPSIVKTGEAFAITVRSEDGSKNLSSGMTPEYQVSLNGQPFRAIPAGSPTLTQLENIKLDKEGVYRFEVRSPNGAQAGALAALSNPVWAQDNPARRIYWGDTHGHSGYAEGQGSPDGYYRFGRDVARLDFLTLSEHDLWMDDFEWKSLQDATRRYQAPGKFTTILGYEWTAQNPIGGHHNVYFANPDGRQRVPIQETLDLGELYKKLRAVANPNEVLIIPHAHQSGDWNRNDAVMERLAEITSGHGTFEYFGNKYLRNGFEMGFVGASDNHVGHPGYSGIRNRQLGGLAAVMARQNTADEIFKALRGRSTYATTGERILLDVTLNGGAMGQRLAESSKRNLQCRVMGTAPVDTVDVIKNGQVIFSRRYLESALAHRAWVQVKVESSTEVFTGHKNPRGARNWRGAIEIKGAKLTDFKAPWFSNPATYRFTRDAQNPNRISFTTNTRGRGQALLLELEGVTADTQVSIQWGASREVDAGDGTTAAMQDRAAADISADAFAVKLGELKQGLARKEISVFQNIDVVQIQLVPADGKLDREFSYADLGEAKPGDYYYVRVTQVDGAMAWSSPIWVGGQPNTTGRPR